MQTAVSSQPISSGPDTRYGTRALRETAAALIATVCLHTDRFSSLHATALNNDQLSYLQHIRVIQTIKAM